MPTETAPVAQGTHHRCPSCRRWILLCVVAGTVAVFLGVREFVRTLPQESASEPYSIDSEVTSRVNTDWLDESVLPVYSAAVDRTIVGKRVEDFGRRFSRATHEYWDKYNVVHIWEFALIEAIPPSTFKDGLAHGPVLRIITRWNGIRETIIYCEIFDQRH